LTLRQREERLLEAGRAGAHEQVGGGPGRHDGAVAHQHELVAALGGVHEEIFGAPPGRDVTRWFSDASALTRYGVPTVNYGTSTGLMDVELGENLEIDGLVRTAEVYARVAMRVCRVV